MMTDQFAPYEPEYIKRWRKYLASTSKPTKPAKPKPRKKGKKAKVKK